MSCSQYPWVTHTIENAVCRANWIIAFCPEGCLSTKAPVIVVRFWTAEGRAEGWQSCAITVKLVGPQCRHIKSGFFLDIGFNAFVFICVFALDCQRKRSLLKKQILTIQDEHFIVGLPMRKQIHAVWRKVSSGSCRHGSSLQRTIVLTFVPTSVSTSCLDSSTVHRSDRSCPTMP